MRLLFVLQPIEAQSQIRKNLLITVYKNFDHLARNYFLVDVKFHVYFRN